MNLKNAGIYNSELFTVFSKDININSLQEILPEHQGMSSNRIFLWDTEKDLILFPDEQFNKFKVHLPDKVKYYKLLKCVCSVYSLPKLQINWVKEISMGDSVYVE